MSFGPAFKAHRYTGWLAAILIGYAAIFISSPQLFRWMGFTDLGVWFADSYAVLAASDAASRGMDPYAKNPLDVFGRPHVYPQGWLWVGNLTLTRADNLLVGLVWVGLFLGLALHWLRPQSWRDALRAMAVLGSPPVLLACQRANNDLVIFAILSIVVPCMVARHPAWSWLALSAIAVAAGLKYYPAAAGALFLWGADRRQVVGRATAMAVALMLVAVAIQADLAAAGVRMPKAEGLMSFGATPALAPLGLNASWSLGVAGLLFGLTFVAGWWLRTLTDWTAPARMQREYLGFVLGGVLLSACFWSNVNFSYRWLFSIWLLPWLWRGMDDARLSSPVRRLIRVTWLLLLLALWASALTVSGLELRHGLAPFETPEQVEQAALMLFGLTQPVVWAFFICLTFLLVPYVRRVVTVIRGTPENSPTDATHGASRSSGC